MAVTPHAIRRYPRTGPVVCGLRMRLNAPIASIRAAVPVERT